jgi:hypothetical protein
VVSSIFVLFVVAVVVVLEMRERGKLYDQSAP